MKSVVCLRACKIQYFRIIWCLPLEACANDDVKFEQLSHSIEHLMYRAWASAPLHGLANTMLTIAAFDDGLLSVQLWSRQGKRMMRVNKVSADHHQPYSRAFHRSPLSVDETHRGEVWHAPSIRLSLNTEDVGDIDLWHAMSFLLVRPFHHSVVNEQHSVKVSSKNGSCIQEYVFEEELFIITCCTITQLGCQNCNLFDCLLDSRRKRAEILLNEPYLFRSSAVRKSSHDAILFWGFHHRSARKGACLRENVSDIIEFC